MSSFSDIYDKNIEENEKNVRFWEEYLQNLKSLNFNVFSEKLSVPILVPMGNRILFRGELKHTNEITVALGSDYFAKCSVMQAEVLRQHRIKDAQSKVDMYNKEREYLENQLSFSKDNVLETEGREIVEVLTEEEEKAWRIKHKENMRKYKQEEKRKQNTGGDVTDNELWNRLEELELQEELLNEFEKQDYDKDVKDDENAKSSIIKEAATMSKQTKLETKNGDILNTKSDKTYVTDESMIIERIKSDPKENLRSHFPKQTSQIELLQQIIDKQNELGIKLSELKNRETSKSKNENDLISKLDEMEQLDELEDEMNRLDDVLEPQDMEGAEDLISQSSVIERRVSFADSDDSNTLELIFKHSSVEPDSTPYNVEKGIQKPSDIYEVYSTLFKGSTSILKKSKNNDHESTQKTKPKVKEDFKDNKTAETLTIKDIKERANEEKSKIAINSRPISLFKKMRMQSK